MSEHLGAPFDPAWTAPGALEEATAQGLSEAEFASIERLIGRPANRLELAVFAVMWSEHCSYKSSKRHLARFPTQAPWVICGPGENAGVIDIGDGDVCVFKMESHNHPSFIEPFQGAATGVGGILRDVFTMGARPVALLNSLRFPDPSSAHCKRLVGGVTRGISSYGNCVGVPTVGGETTFDRSYDRNNLVNVMAVGIARADRVFYAAAAGAGNPVVYVGAKTGRDGIHGATMASAEFSDDAALRRPTVQVGDPFKEKLLLEACLELMASDAILAIQDMGAAGLTSSSFEMASRGGAGIRLELSSVPMREAAMTPIELMLSESQERMLMVLRPGGAAEALRVFERWGLDCAVIGEVTETGAMELLWRGERIAEMPIAPVAGASPVLDRPWSRSPTRPRVDLSRVQHPPLREALFQLIASPDLCSKRWITEQYDSSVMGDTVRHSKGDAAVIRVHGANKALALTADCTPRYCAADPALGGRQAVAEAWRNLIAVGAKPLAITNCLNFGNPEKTEIMGQFAGCVEGMAEACRALAFPVVSGNVSLYNETDGEAIQPTPNVGGVGLIADIDRMVDVAWRREGLSLYCVGGPGTWLECTQYMREICGPEAGPPPPLDLDFEKRVGEFVATLIGDGLVLACHDISDGGLAVAIAEMALASTCGARVDALEADPAFWFGEDQSRYVIACDPALDLASRAGELPVRRLGTTGGDALTLGPAGPISIEELRAANEAYLPALMSARPIPA